jgi:hypothetical protein
MIGHGQVEGFTEKYGMEYQRAYWDESPDPWLVERHEREIFPLLRKRYLFADVRDFLLYDFYSVDGGVNEDVFAYSNRAGEERSLVLYHNKFSTARGWIRTSAAFTRKSPDGERSLVQSSLGEGLGLPNDPEMYTIFRDQIANLEFIRNNRELHEQGLYAELDAYKYQVFVDFRQVRDNEFHQFGQLAAHLAGRGVPGIDHALKEIFLQPVHSPYRELVNPGMFRWVIDNRLTQRIPTNKLLEEVLDQAEAKSLRFVEEVSRLHGGPGLPESIAKRVRTQLEAALSLPAFRLPSGEPDLNKVLSLLAPASDDEPAVWGPLLAWVFTRDLGLLVKADAPQEARLVSRSWLDELLLGKITAEALQGMGMSESDAQRAVSRIKLLMSHSLRQKDPKGKPLPVDKLLQGWLKDNDFQQYIGTNRYQDVLWYNKESFEDILWWLYLASAVDILAEGKNAAETTRLLVECCETVQILKEAEAKSDFKIEKLLANL